MHFSRDGLRAETKAWDNENTENGYDEFVYLKLVHNLAFNLHYI